MFRKLIILLFINIFIVTASPPAYAQQERAAKLYQAALSDYELGNYKQALKKIQRAFSLAEGLKISAYDRAQGTLLLAETLRSLGHYKEAEEEFMKSMDLANQSGSKKNFVLSRVYNNLGALYILTSQFPESEEYFKKSEKVSDKNFIYVSVNNLARLYLAWGKLDLAEEYLEKAKKYTRRNSNNTKPFYLFNLAKYERMKGNYSNAEKYYQESLDLLKKVVGEKHVHYTYVLSDLADFYREQSKFSEAEKIGRNILKIRQDTFDEENPLVPASMVFLADVLADQGKYAEARELANRADRKSTRLNSSH